jgi:hypothetical protein
VAAAAVAVAAAVVVAAVAVVVVVAAAAVAVAAAVVAVVAVVAAADSPAAADRGDYTWPRENKYRPYEARDNNSRRPLRNCCWYLSPFGRHRRSAHNEYLFALFCWND